MIRKVVAIDFFCGAGGSASGFVQAGIPVLAGIDNDPAFRATYTANVVNPDGSPSRFLCLDLMGKTDRHPDGQRREVVSELETIIPHDHQAIFIFCPPCQPFTSVNRGKLSTTLSDLRDQDRNLFFHSLAYVRHFMPAAIFCENVPGIQDSRHGGIWQYFTKEIGKLGYHCGTAIVDTVDFGIPQSRKRSILLAVRSDTLSPDADTRGEVEIAIPASDPSSQQMTVRQAIGHLPAIMAGETDGADPDHRASRLSDINRRRIRMSEEGGTNAIFIGTDLEVSCHARLQARAESQGKRGGYTDAYTRLRADRPSPTITTKAFSYSNGRFGHYDRAQERALSIREMALLQSFPPRYRFHTKSISAAASMIGNAVPPLLAEFYARNILAITAS